MQDRQIGGRVPANDFCFQPAAFTQGDLDVFRPLHNMVIREDVSGRIDHNPRALAVGLPMAKCQVADRHGRRIAHNIDVHDTWSHPLRHQLVLLGQRLQAQIGQMNGRHFGFGAQPTPSQAILNPLGQLGSENPQQDQRRENGKKSEKRRGWCRDGGRGGSRGYGVRRDQYGRFLHRYRRRIPRVGPRIRNRRGTGIRH